MQNVFVKLNNINHKTYAILHKWYMDFSECNFILSFTLKTEFVYKNCQSLVWLMLAIMIYAAIKTSAYSIINYGHFRKSSLSPHRVKRRKTDESSEGQETTNESPKGHSTPITRRSTPRFDIKMHGKGQNLDEENGRFCSKIRVTTWKLFNR